MGLYITVLSLAIFQETPPPEFGLVNCVRTNKHVAIQKISDCAFVAHFHLTISNMENKWAFARVRCFTKEGGDKSVFHSNGKEIEIKKREETWSFFLETPRFSNVKATYQIEYGIADHEALDEYQMKGGFAWTFKDGKMFTGSEDEPVFLSEFKRTIEIKGGGYRIRTMQQTKVYAQQLRYGIVTNLLIPDDGKNTAKRLDKNSPVP